MNEKPPYRIDCGKGVLCMVKVYPITFEGRKVGEAKVERLGMFLLIRCECDAGLQGNCSIKACCGGKEVELGRCFPCNSGFRLERRMSVKYFLDTDLSFHILRENEEKFIPLYTDKPFESLSQLSLAHFAVRHGQSGLVFCIKDQSQDQQGNGQNPSHQDK